MQADRAGHLSRAWQRALAEHDAAVAAFLGVVDAIPGSRWRLPSAPGKWSPADEVLHVVLSYEVALRGVRTGAGMRPRVSPMRARVLRWLVLPVMLNSTWFPRARAPVEIRPPVDGSLQSDTARATLRTRLGEAARAVREEVPA